MVLYQHAPRLFFDPAFADDTFDADRRGYIRGYCPYAPEKYPSDRFLPSLLCGVLLYDHLIFGNKDWYSFSKSKDKPRMLIYYSLDDIIPRQQGGL